MIGKLLARWQTPMGLADQGEVVGSSPTVAV